MAHGGLRGGGAGRLRPPAGGSNAAAAGDRALTQSELAARRPVRLAGTVTYLRDTPEVVNFILDDGTGGVMVYPDHRPPPLRPGQRVTVDGFTERGRLLLSVTARSVVV